MRRRRNKKKSLFALLCGSIILLLCVVSILLTGASAITRDNIAHHLQMFSDYVSGGDPAGAFTYGDVSIDGMGYQKSARVEKPELSFVKRTLLGDQSISVSTPLMKVLPDAVTASRLVFEFPEPITIGRNGQPLAIMTFPEPLRYSYFSGLQQKVPTIIHTLKLPAQIILTPPASPEYAFPRTVISYDENPIAHSKTLPEARQRETEYQFRNVTIESDDKTGMSIGALTGHFSEQPGADNRLDGQATLVVSDFTAHTQEKTPKTYNLAADIAYTSDAPAMQLDGFWPATGNIDMKLNKIVLMNDNFRITVTGAFSRVSDDLLPNGQVNIDIDNVNQFLASDLMPLPVSTAFAEELPKMTGQPLDTLTHVTVTLKREKNGTFYIGNMTFEELAASLIADMLQLKGTPTLPEPPPAVSPPVTPETPIKESM